MSSTLVQAVEQLLEAADEPDDALRSVVRALAEEPGIGWAGIAFREGDHLVLGPTAGTPDERSRSHVPVVFQGDEVGSLRVDGEADGPTLERVAQLVSPLVLIGWDTGGEAWEP